MMFIIGDGNNMYDFTYIENVAHAHICAERALASDGAVAERAAGEETKVTIPRRPAGVSSIAAVGSAPVQHTFLCSIRLSRDLQFFKPKTAVKDPRVTYTIIYKCEKFSLCIFFLLATAVIPLHNHPGMTVFSKLLLGTMHIKAYDLVDQFNFEDSSCLSQSPCNTSVLYPTSGGNIHAFTAITPCAMLDVIGPPYSKEDGRDCSYYKDTPYTPLSNGEWIMCEERGERYGWLEEIEMPNELEMDRIEYLGLQIETESNLGFL